MEHSEKNTRDNGYSFEQPLVGYGLVIYDNWCEELRKETNQELTDIECMFLARKYYKEPIACNLVSYGNNIVASVKDEFREIVEEILQRDKISFCCCVWSSLRSSRNAIKSGFFCMD